MSIFYGDRKAFDALDRQHNRFLRLLRPGVKADGDRMLINSVDAYESISRGFVCKIEVISDSATIDPKAVLGTSFTVEMLREDGSSRYFNGYAFSFRLVRADGGFAFYEMTLEPWLSFLKLRHDNRTFPKISLFDLTNSVFEVYIARKWESHLLDKNIAKTYRNQYAETDFNFVHRHWEASGWSYIYHHNADSHVLAITDDTATSAQQIAGNFNGA